MHAFAWGAAYVCVRVDTLELDRCLRSKHRIDVGRCGVMGRGQKYVITQSFMTLPQGNLESMWVGVGLLGRGQKYVVKQVV